MDKHKAEKILNQTRLYQLLSLGQKQLQRIFLTRWSESCKAKLAGISEWTNDATSGNELVQLCPNADSRVIKSLKGGQVELWDITKTNIAIDAITQAMGKLYKKHKVKETSKITSLVNFRNRICHGSYTYTLDEFEKLWKECAKLLIDLGETLTTVESLKDDLMKLGLQEEQIDLDFDLQKSIDKANELLMDEKYLDGIALYNELLNKQCYSSKSLATILLNRGQMYLELDDSDSLQKAKQDTLMSINLWPSYWKSHHQMGIIQKILKEWYEAEASLEKALAINPQSQEVQDDIALLRDHIGKMIIEEPLDPDYLPYSKAEIVKANCVKYSINEKDFMNLLKLNLEIPITGDVLNGHQYRDGINVVKDYRTAAGYYAKAGAQGNPEALYNLARLYFFGNGVQQNYKRALEYSLKAAAADFL